MNDQPFLCFYIIAAIVVLIRITRWIRRYLLKREAKGTRCIVLEATLIGEVLIWIAGIIGVIFSTPHPISLLIVALWVCCAITNSALCYREEKGTLNRSLKIVLQQDIPLATALELISNTFHSRLALRLKRYVTALKRGDTARSHSLLSRLPLDPDTLALMSDEIPPTSIALDNSFRKSLSPGYLNTRFWQTKSQVNYQLTYLVFLLLGCSLIGEQTSRSILPLVTDFDATLSSQSSLFVGNLDLLTSTFSFFTLSFIVWLLLALLIPKLPVWSVRLIPWFGRSWIDRQRSMVLRSLARGVRVGSPDDEILKIAGEASRVKWIASRCRKSALLIGAGSAFVKAIRQSGIIRANEISWLASASSSGNLPTALDSLANSIDRRADYRWQVRVTWLVPVILILTGIYAFANLSVIFRIIYGLVSQLA